MLITSMATAIYEEVVFRAIGIGSFIKSGIKPNKAILLTAILFSIFHLYTVYDKEALDIILKLLNTFMMGVVFGYIYYASKNILYVIVIHMVWDFESFLANSYILDNTGVIITVILFITTLSYFYWSLRKMLT